MELYLSLGPLRHQHIVYEKLAIVKNNRVIRLEQWNNSIYIPVSVRSVDVSVVQGNRMLGNYTEYNIIIITLAGNQSMSAQFNHVMMHCCS